MDTGLQGQVAIVTGAGMPASPSGDLVGNGSAIALALAREGCAVALVDVDEAAAARTRDRIAAQGGQAAAFAADVSSEDAVASAVDAIVRELGAPTVLVNNVGVLGPRGSAVDLDPEGWDPTMGVNVKSMMLTARHVLPHMEAAGGGAIVNLSSISGVLARMDGDPRSANLVYATSKGAVLALSRAMASQHGRAGVRVNAVVPGPVFSAMIADEISPEVRDFRRRSTMLGTEGTPWDVANAVVFLAGATGRWITGTSLVVDGGATAARYTVGPMH